MVIRNRVVSYKVIGTENKVSKSDRGQQDN